jgi:alpha-beta hydrolase superfamily lysophospholipase
MPKEPAESRFITRDGTELYLRSRAAEGKARGTVLIAHGMGETADYYTEFAKTAACAGYRVMVPEMRGHGRTAGDIASDRYTGGDPGPDSLHRMAEDLCDVARDAAGEPGAAERGALPLYLLGHSMGSVAAQLCAAMGAAPLRGLILTGVLSPDGSQAMLGYAQREVLERGPKADCRDTFHRMFDEAMTAYGPGGTPLDWITSDPEMVRQSLAMPYTNVAFTNEFYRDFLCALRETGREDTFRRLPRTLPVLILGGGEDYVGRHGQGPQAKYRQFQELGLGDVELTVYPGLRHSILREKARARVTQDILAWLAAHP